MFVAENQNHHRETPVRSIAKRKQRTTVAIEPSAMASNQRMIAAALLLLGLVAAAEARPSRRVLDSSTASSEDLISSASEQSSSSTASEHTNIAWVVPVKILVQGGGRPGSVPSMQETNIVASFITAANAALGVDGIAREDATGTCFSGMRRTDSIQISGPTVTA